VRNLIKLAPRPIHKALRDLSRRRSERRYFAQGLTRVKCGAYDIEAPKNHLLVNLLKAQPYRDLCVGITAKYVSAKYPDGTMIDIGANIGDTAALIATYARNKLMLVEGSDYFFELLVRNTSHLPNELTLKNVLVSDGRKISGRFRHWGGTASFHEGASETLQIQTERLSAIAADENSVCFIKLDTDGYDFGILSDSIEWLAAEHPAILFENQIRNAPDRIAADELYATLSQIGYTFFIVWDDPGFHLVSTTSLDILKDLNRYLFKVFQNDGHRSICNYDVLCLHGNDEDVYRNICEWYKDY
jgi:FkbM family methyltransferase